LLDDLAIASVADRPDVVAVRPEFTSPEFLFHLRQFQRLFRCQFFDESDDLAAGVFWQELAEDMDVVPVEADLMNIYCKAFFESFECFEDDALDLGIQNCFSVFDSELDMIIALGDVVVPPPKIAFDVRHSLSLAGCCYKE